MKEIKTNKKKSTERYKTRWLKYREQKMIQEIIALKKKLIKYPFLKNKLLKYELEKKLRSWFIMRHNPKDRKPFREYENFIRIGLTRLWKFRRKNPKLKFDNIQDQVNMMNQIKKEKEKENNDE